MAQSLPTHDSRCTATYPRASLRWRGVAGLISVLVIVIGSPLTVSAKGRAAQVAGQFYPAEADELRSLVTTLVAKQPAPVRAESPRILIVPHAGYPYSGAVAARAYRQIQGQTYDAVIVVGFTHRQSFSGASIDTVATYHTPLGEIPVDQDVAAFLREYPGITHVDTAHASAEHSLEVQLPFLQVALGAFKFVPILMGSDTFEDAQALATALAALAQRGNYLFVFTTDLSHYHPYDEAKRIDAGMVATLEFETPHAAHRLFQQGIVEACGRGPVVSALLLAVKLGYLERALLAYANSGDTTGDRSRVVGYAAMSMYDHPAEAAPTISPEAGAALVHAARETLEQWLDTLGTTQADAIEARLLEQFPELKQATGLFVTLRRHGELRGCIGRIESDQPLATLLPPIALDAALRDGRFAPVTKDELDDIVIDVSVLSSPRRLTEPSAIVAGRDGVILRQGNQQGVFLPQVWEETGWTRLEFLRELASQKAGLPPDAWQHAELFVFQDQAFSE